MNVPTPCFACGKVFDAACGDHQPSGGTIFEASGNYGSTVFDPFVGHTSLTINLCDDCMINRQSYVALVTRETKTETQVYQWDPKRRHYE